MVMRAAAAAAVAENARDVTRPPCSLSDVEFDLQFVFDFHSSARDPDRLDAEITLADRDGAVVSAVLEDGVNGRRPGLAVNRELAGRVPGVRSCRRDLGRYERDLRKP